MKLYRFRWLFILLFSSTILTAQDDSDQQEPKLDKDVKQAYEAYDAQQYYEAIELLKDAFSEVRGREKKTAILFKIAQSYRNILDYKNAENYYNKANKLGYDGPEAALYYADMLKAQGEYEEAITAYKDVKKAYPDNVAAEQGIESAKQAVEWMDKPGRYQVFIMEDINSKELDFAPIYGGGRRDNNEIIFSSAREESTGGKEDGWTGQEFTDLYITKAERKRRRRGRGGDEVENPSEMKWSTPVLLDEEEVVNTKNNEGGATFDSRKKDLYFTRCMVEKNVKNLCGIYMTEQRGQSWSDPERQIFGTDTLANVGQPTISPDDKYMYFVSTDFGANGRDIFMSTYDRREDIWRTPKNLGPKVNTDGDEYWPFAHSDGYLYFSSNGHPGMGGLDIFKIKMGEDGMPMPDAKAENLEYPINTNFEDYGLVFQPGTDKVGFMVSNRKNKRGSLDDDIYAVVKTPLVFKLEGVITSSKTGQPVPQATVKLEGSNGTSLVVNTDGDGYYEFEEGSLDPDEQYELSFEKDKFLTNTGNVTTIGVPLSSFEFVPSDNQFLNVLRLNKELDPIEEPIVLPNVFFDLAKWDLRPEARAALDSVVTILERNPRIVIELRSHTDYRDTERSNEILSQKRADTSVAYLISKGIAEDRLVSKGMGESEPFTIPENYKGYGAGQFEAGQELTEKYIKTLAPEKQQVANQINRRTDFKVLRDDYVPAGAPEGADVGEILEEKANEKDPKGKIHVIKGRESFGRIAREYNINIVELKRLNNGLRGVRPFDGLQLKVSPDGSYEEWDANHYQVQRRGQSIKDVAKKLDMDDDVIEELNPDVDKRNLPVGYWLLIKE